MTTFITRKLLADFAYLAVCGRLCLRVVYLCITIIISFSFRILSSGSVHRSLFSSLLPSGV